MKKKVISLLCLILVFSILSFSVNAAMLETTVQPRYTYIKVATAVCTLSGTTINYSAGVTADQDTTQSVKVEVYLQYRTAGSNNSWTPVYLKTATGTSYCTAAGSKGMLSGYEYRIKAVATATGSYGTETATTYSVIVP